MSRHRGVALARVILVLGATALPAQATPQKWPFTFDPAIAADPAGTQQKIATGTAMYPDLPVTRMTTLQSDAVTLYFWPEAAALLESARTSATAASMVWPTTTTMCAAHAGFSIPTPLVTSASLPCSDADAAIRQRLAGRVACVDVEQPERFALAFIPSQARQSTASIEKMIGQAGEAWTHAAPPQVGLLPATFIPTLRTALAKIRHDTLALQLGRDKLAFDEAIAIANNHAACFDPSVKTALVSSVTSMVNESIAASAYLEQLKTSGLATATQEQVCLAAKSRVRPALTIPSLTRVEREFLAFWLGGTYWRMRGGGLIPLGSTQDARWYFLHEAFTQIGRMVGGQDGADAANQLYWPIFEGWGDWHDMGHTTGGGSKDRYDDLVSMTARGERQAKLAADLLAGRSYDATDLTTSGLALGPCYFRGYFPLDGFRYAAQLLPAPPYSDGISGPTTIGEFCFGASLGLGLAHVLLDGASTTQPAVDLCAGKECGDDGCEGSCGSCATGLTCEQGACVACVPDCAGKTCGDDGCGGSCGTSCTDGSGPPDGGTGIDPTTGAGCGCGSVPSTEGLLASALFGSGFLLLLARRRRSQQPPRVSDRA